MCLKGYNRKNPGRQTVVFADSFFGNIKLHLKAGLTLCAQLAYSLAMRYLLAYLRVCGGSL